MKQVKKILLLATCSVLIIGASTGCRTRAAEDRRDGHYNDGRDGHRNDGQRNDDHRRDGHRNDGHRYDGHRYDGNRNQNNGRDALRDYGNRNGGRIDGRDGNTFRDVGDDIRDIGRDIGHGAEEIVDDLSRDGRSHPRYRGGTQNNNYNR